MIRTRTRAAAAAALLARRLLPIRSPMGGHVIFA
jgi:hypothetical protein